jgi:hypothetical protein
LQNPNPDSILRTEALEALGRISGLHNDSRFDT